MAGVFPKASENIEFESFVASRGNRLLNLFNEQNLRGILDLLSLCKKSVTYNVHSIMIIVILVLYLEFFLFVSTFY